MRIYKAPKDYPLQLFTTIENRMFFLARPCIDDIVNSEPVEMAMLIKGVGREGTTEFLKNFGPTWLSKRGLVYFPDKN